MNRKLFLTCLVALACLFMAWLPARAASVIPLYLEELVEHSAVVFEGRCVANRVERDALTNLVVTYTTFEVKDTLKGSVESTHVIKQVGGTLPEANLNYNVEGIPSFTPGEDYVVFLAGVSSVGFSSPIGLAQGRFSVRGEGQERRVANGRDFKDMAARIADRLPPAAAARLRESEGPVRDIALDDLKHVVRNHGKGAR